MIGCGQNRQGHDGNTDTAEKKQKRRHRHLGPNPAGFHQKVDHCQGADGVGHIIGSLGQSDVAGGADLDAPEDLFLTAILPESAQKVYQKPFTRIPQETGGCQGDQQRAGRSDRQ